MGGCVVGSEHSGSQKYREEPKKLQKKSSDIPLVNPDSKIQSEIQSLPPSSSIQKLAKPITSVFTLEDNLAKQQLDSEQWRNEHSYAPSVIVKKNKKRVNRDSKQKSKQQEKAKQAQKNWETASREQDSEQSCYSKIHLKTTQVDIEFMLPNSRAGPLVVPFICFQDYIPK